jgi:hypothetical protein
MKSLVSNLLALAATLALAGCAGVTVTTDYDHTATFGKYKTYVLAPGKHDQSLSASAEAQLRSTLRTELSKRGLTEVTSGKADIAIVRHVFVQHNVTVDHYTDYGYGYHDTWPYGYGYYSMWAGAPQTYVDVTHYAEGTLVLDVVDLHTKRLVFRGTGTAVVGSSSENVEKIHEAVEKMVEALPR